MLLAHGLSAVIFPIALCQKFYKIPEKSFCEEKTKEALQNWLWEHTDSEVVDRGRWFYAVKKGGNRPPKAWECRRPGCKARCDGRRISGIICRNVRVKENHSSQSICELQVKEVL